ncbi:flagellar biosynthetic protein FliO [Aquabacterium sp.]|uniref:flagellar biosynthetic protein FliO n=1 Tax=Aquabacterium sp. TaxID=1872578 RepID=UPI002D12A39D|nr:flagellar biosynthetic protein FliO [Aquabacterium sp.]HSW06370.1 flagellar biosynthetic protein FliO [Aquabacterium sp.]
MFRARPAALALTAGFFAQVLRAQPSSPIPFKTEAATQLPGSGQWLGAILACLVLLAVLLWFLKRHGPKVAARWGTPIARTGGRRIRIVERTALSAGVSLVAIEYDGRKLLLASGSSHTTCLRDEPMAACAPGIEEGR